MNTPSKDQQPDALALLIAEQLASARREKGLSVSELHRKTGISRTVLQGYEAGRNKPGARELRLLAETLDCSPNRLLFGSDDFRQRSNLDALLGDTSSAIRTAQFAIVLQLLTAEEQRAVLSLVTLMAEGRAGGRESLAHQMAVADGTVARLEAAGPKATEQAVLGLIGGESAIQGMLEAEATSPPAKGLKKPKG